MSKHTLFLKIALVLMALPVLFFCLYVLPIIALRNDGYYPTTWLYPTLVLLAFSSLPYFYALRETFKLLQLIDQNEAFSNRAVASLKAINTAALAVASCYTILLPILYKLADLSDSPGILLVALVLWFACLVVAVFAAVLKKLLENAVTLKSENDLTV